MRFIKMKKVFSTLCHILFIFLFITVSNAYENADSAKSSLKQGVHQTHYQDGKVKEEMYYKNGKLDGPFKKYDENGLLMEELNFQDGKLDGIITKYYVNGDYAMEEIYEDGKLVSSKWIDNRQLEKKKQREQRLNKLSEFQSPNNTKTEDTVEIGTTDVKYISYFAKLKKQIELHWTYPEESRDRNEEGQLILIFTITKKGDLEEIQLVSSSGYAHLDNEAVRAIRVASPFPKFPQDWGELEKLHVKATFIYNFGGFTRKKP